MGMIFVDPVKFNQLSGDMKLFIVELLWSESPAVEVTWNGPKIEIRVVYLNWGVIIVLDLIFLDLQELPKFRTLLKNLEFPETINFQNFSGNFGSEPRRISSERSKQ